MAGLNSFPRFRGTVHYRFRQRGGGDDRNIREPATLRAMIDYLRNNPVRRGLVGEATDWPWSSARFYADMDEVALEMDGIAEFVA